MPQIIVKGISEETCAGLAPVISERVASLIDVPSDWIVVEYNPASFFRSGVRDESLCMVTVEWKRRSRELQKKVAEALSELLMSEAIQTVEVLYINLDMEDFYEFKK